MSSSTKRKSLMIGSIIVAVVALILVAIAVIGSRQGDDGQPNDADTPSTAQGLDDQQRPDAEDSAGEGFSTPISDYTGRRMLTPNNPAGEPLGQQRNTPQDICSTDETTRNSGVSIQATEPVTLWSEQDGPSRIDHGAPVGYSQSPQGAALAVWNLYTLLRPNNDTTWWIFDHRMDISDEELAGFDEDRGSAEWDADDPARKQIAPSAYKVSSCSNDYMVIDIARQMPFDQQGQRRDPMQYTSLRFGAVWTDGDWSLQTEPMKYSIGTIDTLDGWNQWNF